ncbi:MAG: ABC transporter ATP-binding protein [Actinomycetota bacterium]
MADVEFEGVTKVYRDGTVAVEGLDLHVEDGELFVFLGPSGCGKTTILRMVAGLEGTTDGRILIGGEDVTDYPPPKRDVAMVFQHLALYPHLNVYDNIAFGARMRRLKKADVDERVRRAAGLLGLEDVLKKRPRSLSGGQAQRVAMGRAIIREPHAFLMDEPLSNLDSRLRTQLRGELVRIQREVGVTTLYVTHDQSEAMVLGDRVGVLREGVLQQVEAPRLMYERPDNLFVAGFVGSPPMNLAEATLDRTDGGDLVLIFGGHRITVDSRTLDLRPRMADYVRRQVVIGIRPEHLRSAASIGAAEDARIRVPVEGTEIIGADVYATFVMDSPLLLVEDPREADVEEPLDESWPAERANVWMARVGSAPVDTAADVELAMEPGRLYLFDPRTGESIEE